MNEQIIEAVFLAFTMGGIVGAAAALSLKSSHLWHRSDKPSGKLKPVPVRHPRRRD
jgi:hypothetical protein